MIDVDKLSRDIASDKRSFPDSTCSEHNQSVCISASDAEAIDDARSLAADTRLTLDLHASLFHAPQFASAEQHPVLTLLMKAHTTPSSVKTDSVFI